MHFQSLGSDTSYDWIGLFVQVLLPGLIAFGAAWAGAYFAFRYQNKKVEEQETTSEIAAINMVVITLGQMQNALANYKKQILDEHPANPLRAFSMQPATIGNYSHLVLHSDSLAFLCETDHRQVPMTVGYMNTQFHRAVAAIDDRNNHHLTVVQPKMAAFAAPPATALTDAIVLRALGIDQKRIQESYTDNMYLQVESALDDIQKCKNDLQAAAKTLYPKGRTVTSRIEN